MIMCSLGSVVDVSAGQPAPKPNEFAADGKPFIRAGSLEMLLNGGSLSKCEKISEVTAQEKRFRLYPKDTIVFAKSGMSATLGRVYRLTEPAFVVSHLAALVPTGDYDPGYLTYWLRRTPPSHLIKDPAYPSIRISEIEEVQVPDVPLQEQRRLAAILDKADGVRRKRNRFISHIDDLLRSVFVHLVGFKSPEYPDWKPFRVEDLAAPHKGSMRTGPFGSDLRHSEFVDAGVAVLGIDNAVQNTFAWGERRYITEDKFDRLKRYQVYSGDVIVTIMGTTGRSAVVPDDIPKAITTKHLATISVNKRIIVPEFLSYAIHSDPLIIRQIERANKGAIMDGLNLGIIKSLEIHLPPIELQERFAEVLKRLNKTKEALGKKEGSGEALFLSLSQRAFRGEL